MRRRSLASLVIALAAVALLLPGGTSAQTATRLIASVGPGFEISLTDANGRRVTSLDPGTFEIVVNDRSDIHNFHLRGPGVDQRTAVEFVGQTTWTVTFAAGTYTFQCDPHSTQLRGTFLVGGQPAPVPARKRLVGTVGPGFTISLKTAAGARVRTAKAGLYDITVRDRARIHNFHLVGANVNRKTTVPFVGTVTWRKVRIQAGKTYRFRCDPHRTRLRGSFRGVA